MASQPTREDEVVRVLRLRLEAEEARMEARPPCILRSLHQWTSQLASSAQGDDRSIPSLRLHTPNLSLLAFFTTEFLYRGAQKCGTVTKSTVQSLVYAARLP